MQRPCIGVAGRRCPRLTTRTRCPQCEREWQRQRNARPGRAIYNGEWAAYSRAQREANPYCAVCGTSRDLTVDHGGAGVLCRTHHSALEARRRAERKRQREGG